jgi:single-strand DNA-binding protein
MSFNKIILVGNLGKDVELRYTPQGDAVGTFSVATSEKRKDKQGVLQDVTLWFKVTVWRKTAEAAAKYLAKGSPVYIEGRLRTEEWEDRDGNKRFSLEVNATEMQFIGGGQNSSGEHRPQRQAEPDNDGREVNPDGTYYIGGTLYAADGTELM